jgi:hypothetical protein
MLSDHPDIGRMSSAAHPGGPAAYAARLLADMAGTPPIAMHFGVWQGEAPELVGLTSLKKLTVQDGSAELSYWIGRAHQRQGLASAAAALTLRHGFEALGLRRIDAHVLRHRAVLGDDLRGGNLGSEKILHGLGFVRAARPDMPVEGRFAESSPGGVWRFYELARAG